MASNFADRARFDMKIDFGKRLSTCRTMCRCAASTNGLSRIWFPNMASIRRKDPYTGTVLVFRARRADRLKLLYWDDEEDQETVWGTVSPMNGLVMAYTRLEDTTFTWPAIKDGLMALNHA